MNDSGQGNEDDHLMHSRAKYNRDIDAQPLECDSKLSSEHLEPLKVLCMPLSCSATFLTANVISFGVCRTSIKGRPCSNSSMINCTRTRIGQVYVSLMPALMLFFRTLLFRLNRSSAYAMKGVFQSFMGVMNTSARRKEAPYSAIVFANR